MAYSNVNSPEKSCS